MSGSAGMRGYLVQTVIALVDAFQDDNDWLELTLEPDELGDKVDVLWMYRDRMRAVQVKSSQNLIGSAQVGCWANDLKTKTLERLAELERQGRRFPTVDYELHLVGPCTREVVQWGRKDDVFVPPPKNLDLDGLSSEAAFKLGRRLETAGFQRLSFVEVGRLIDELMAGLAKRSTAGKPLSRDELHRFLSERLSSAAEETPLIALPGDPPVNPELFLGRAEDLERLKAQLGANPMRVLTGRPSGAKSMAVRGWPGIGKTATATVLGNDPDIRRIFPDGVLWTSLGENPRLIQEMAVWGRKLGTDEILHAPTPKEAVERLAALLRAKRMLLIVDDVWNPDHAAPFQQARGKDCSLLVTTRQPAVAELISVPDNVYNLPPLTPESSLELLRILAPSVVARHPAECLELAADLECLPLALHVAGRLLHKESKMGWSVTNLLTELRQGAAVIRAKAPADRIDLETQTIPSVAALLKRSTDRLDPFLLDCFAFLGPQAPKPATFDLERLKSAWLVDDPKPTARALVDFGLLEPVGDRFQMHALLVAHANSFLTEE